MPITYKPARLGISQSQALAEAYASATATQPELITIALYHSSFKDDDGNTTAIYCVNDFEPLNATIEAGAALHGGLEVTFQPIPFTFVRPEEADGSAPPEVTLEIDNAAREVSPYLKTASQSKEPVILIARVYLHSDTSAPHEIPPLQLVLKNVVVTPQKVSAKASYGDLVNRRFPTQEYGRRTHPGLTAG